MLELIGKEITIANLMREMVENGFYDESDMADSVLKEVLESGVITFLEKETDDTKNVAFIVTIKADNDEWLGATYIEITDIY